MIVSPVGQSVSTQSERIPPKCFFPCACGWQEGQAETVLDFVVKLQFVVALNSSWACFQKELLPLYAPVRRLFPPKLECCGWWWEAEEGYCQPLKRRRVCAVNLEFTWSSKSGAAGCSGIWSCFQLCSDRQQEVSLVFEDDCHHALKCTWICCSKIVLMWAALHQYLHMTNGMEQWLIVFTSLRGLLCLQN